MGRLAPSEVVSRDFQALADARAARARLLAGRYPASREALSFFAGIASFQGQLFASLPSNPAMDRGFALDEVLPGRLPLARLVAEKGPERLREQARGYDEAACRESLRAYFTRQDTTSTRSFFARVLLQPAIYAWVREGQRPGFPAEDDSSRRITLPNLDREAPRPTSTCPHCGHLPQAGCLRPQGDGMALTLICSLCFGEWPFSRLRCPGCAETDHRNINFYSAPEFAHLQVQTCDSCTAYLHLIDLGKEPDAVADADELSALPLDFWALEKGYRKVQPNLAGI
jgi:formate dehydrogenase maturation protein FdhE